MSQMHPGLNLNFLVFISKSPLATTIDQYRLVSLGKFLFKLITNIIARQLGGIFAFYLKISLGSSQVATLEII